ncbi:MAG: ROK family protein [Lachnospiraceae bacterium]|nr:ROK family protein [Lachnospiraceae bacterium]
MYRVGIDLGGTNIKAGIVNEKYEIIIQDSIPTKVERPYQEIIKDMAELVQSLVRNAKIREDDIEGIGIGSPGTVDAETGVVVYSNNFDWENIPLVKELHKYINFPIAVSNDANCAALGEVKAGAAKDAANVVLLTLGTGVGGGVVVNGKIFEGGHAGGAELGHTMLVRGGELCTCGRKGCLEAYASATALIRQTKEAAKNNPDSKILEFCNHDENQINGKTVFDAALENDETAKKVVQDYIEYLGDGIVDFVNIFRPDKVLLSGGVCNQGTVLTNPLNVYVQKYCFAGSKGVIPTVTCATLGNSAGIIGASALTEA